MKSFCNCNLFHIRTYCHVTHITYILNNEEQLDSFIYLLLIAKLYLLDFWNRFWVKTSLLYVLAGKNTCRFLSKNHPNTSYLTNQLHLLMNWLLLKLQCISAKYNFNPLLDEFISKSTMYKNRNISVVMTEIFTSLKQLHHQCSLKGPSNYTLPLLRTFGG